MNATDIWGFNPTDASLIAIAVRLFIAAILGALIGLERELSNHPAGLRTHMLTSTAAAAFTILTYEIYHEMVDLNSTIARLDPLRVIEAVTAGVAFLAAGAIIRSGAHIKGLTTGAGMWAAGAIGVASGSGFYAVAALATVMVLAITLLIGLLEDRLIKPRIEDDPTERDNLDQH